jgi:hypothetical protein
MPKASHVVLGCVLLLGLVAAGCGGAATSASLTATTCGTPYRFRLNDKTALSGSCAAMLPPKPIRVTVRLGEQFSVEILHEQDGRLDFPVPRPAGIAVGLVKHTGATASYVGRSVGTSELMARHTRFCVGTDPAIGTCPVLKVRVISR